MISTCGSVFIAAVHAACDRTVQDRLCHFADLAVKPAPLPTKEGNAAAWRQPKAFAGLPVCSYGPLYSTVAPQNRALVNDVALSRLKADD
jgi:hypothetical protein